MKFNLFNGKNKVGSYSSETNANRVRNRAVKRSKMDADLERQEKKDFRVVRSRTRTRTRRDEF